MGDRAEEPGKPAQAHPHGRYGHVLRLLYCADCGHTLNLNRTKSLAREKDSYTCGAYKQQRGKCTAHFIRAIVLEQLVLENLRAVIAFAREDTDGFIRQAMSNRMEAQMQEQAQAKRTLEQQERRIAEIDGIIKRLYEDNISGKLTDERFSKMSADYEQEQAHLQMSVKELQQTVEACEQQKRKHGQLHQVGEEIHCSGQAVSRTSPCSCGKNHRSCAGKSSGHRTQQIDIHYNFIGEIGLSHAIDKKESA